jgi:hypothetical protein
LVLGEKKMRRILAIVLVTALFSGCVNGRFQEKSIHSDACGGTVKGFTITYIAYGDSKLMVIPLSKIRNHTEWRFILDPLTIRKSDSGKDYKDSKVTITGKRAEDVWLNTAALGDMLVSGTYNGATDHMLTACVEITPEPHLGDSFYFVVDVEDIGTLDPRADIN